MTIQSWHKHCVQPGPRERRRDLHKRLSQTCLWVFECPMQRRGSPMACCWDRGSSSSRPGWRSMWNKLSWRRSPLAPQDSLQPGDSQTGEQSYQRSPHTVAEVLGPTTDFPTWGFSKGTENPPGNFTLKVSGIWLQTSAGLGNRDSWRAQTKPCVHQDPGESSTDPTRDLSQACQWVFGSLWRRRGPAAACCSVRGTACSGPGRCGVLAWVLLEEVINTPNYRQGTQPQPSAENWN